MTDAGLPSPTLHAANLTKVYDGPANGLTVLRAISLELSGGDNVAILGPSGSGKSTLLHLFGGLDRPTSGSLHVNGVDVLALADRELAAFRNRTIGFVFQDHYLLPQCTVLENVLVPSLPAGGATDTVVRRAKELLERVGLSARLDHLPAELSGGERQRVAIARALINQPALLLCDEPTGNLDRKTGATVADLLLELHRTSGMMLVVVTHSLELASRMSRRFELQDGELVALK